LYNILRVLKHGIPWRATGSSNGEYAWQTIHRRFTHLVNNEHFFKVKKRKDGVEKVRDTEERPRQTTLSKHLHRHDVHKERRFSIEKKENKTRAFEA